MSEKAVSSQKSVISDAEVLLAKFQFKFFCAIALLLSALAGCHNTKNNTNFVLPPAAFNATNAFAEIESLQKIGTRPSGSPGAKKAAEHFAARLRSMGINTVIDEFGDDTPEGKTVFRNVIGTIFAGNNATNGEEWVILGAHYDTKTGIADNFTGANDSASGVAVLLELARVIKSELKTAHLEGSPHLSVNMNFMFSFFDGEECRQNYAANDGLHGSRRLAGQLQKDGRKSKIRAVIILDMVGDRNLNVTIPRNSTSCLISALFKAAEAENTRAKFALYDREILDDHHPFMAAGIPSLDIIDFEYGSLPGKNDYWHTPEDTADKLSPASLETIGRTVLRLLDGLKKPS